jgi:CDP-paratose 2-epimerase
VSTARSEARSIPNGKPRDAVSTVEGTTLITGGAGFIGANLAHHIAKNGGHVVLLDNLSRPEVHLNGDWLRTQHGGRVQLVVGDVRDLRAVREVVAQADRVFHFAAQVAVTSSIADPQADFAVNAQGTLNVLSAIKEQKRQIPLFFTSTNKVYGALPNLLLEKQGPRWTPVSHRMESIGIDESQPLDFHSPYGCSKGAADQYVLDWARSYGMPNVVFRMSCIYGPRQFGNEDQGWVAHFLIRALRGEEIVIYGDGRQVRDVLYVDDLIDAFHKALDALGTVRGEVFNIGGGAANTVSLIELVDLIHEMTNVRVRLKYASVRSGDQRWYVSGTRKIESRLDWQPRTDLREGLRQLIEWLDESGVRATSLPVSCVASALPSRKAEYHP